MAPRATAAIRGNGGGSAALPVRGSAGPRRAGGVSGAVGRGCGRRRAAVPDARADRRSRVLAAAACV